MNNGIYIISDIAKILDIPYQKVLRWINAYWDGKLGKEFKSTYSWTVEGSKAVNFHTLIELYVLIQLAENDIPTHQVLIAHKELSKLMDTLYPFAHKTVLQNIRTDGKKLLIEIGGNLISLDGTRQIKLDFMKIFFNNIEFDDNQLVNKFWPRGKSNSVCIDPRRQFGHPVVDHTNIYPETLYNLHKGGESIEFIASLYDLDQQTIEDAINYCYAS